MDIGERLAQLAKRRADKYGRIHETLFHRIEQAKEGERVASWYGRDSSWHPRLTRSPPIAVWSSRPGAKKRLAAKLRKASADVRAVLQRSKIEDYEGGQVDEAVPSVRAIATVARSVVWRRTSRSGRYFRRHQRDQRPGRFDCGRPIGPRSCGWLRRHRDSSRGLRGWSERHDQPDLRGSVHHNAVGQRPRQTDIGGHQEHRSQQATWSCAGLRPLLGKHLEQRRVALGRARPALHGSEPELPPR